MKHFLSELSVHSEFMASNRLKLVVTTAVIFLIASGAGLLFARVPSSATTVIVGTVVAVLTVIIWRKPVSLTFVTLALLPFHSLLMRVLTVDVHLSPSVVFMFSMWKEYALLIILLRVAPWRHPMRWVALDFIVTTFIAFNALYSFAADSAVMGAYGFRGVVEPFLFYFVGRFLQFGDRNLKKLTRVLIATALITAIFGIVQVFILGRPFLNRYRTETGSVNLSHFAYMGGTWQIRASSTFTSPNDFGMFLAIVLLIGLGVFLTSYRPKKLALFGTVFVLVFALLLTFSRSSWVSFAFGFATLFLLRRRVKATLITALLVIGLLAVPVAIRLNIPQRIIETLSLSDPSAQGKLPSILSGIDFVLANPLGIGLGMTGPRSARYGEIVQFHSENYYVLMAMETGILGLLLYLIMIALTVFLINRSYLAEQNKDFRGFAFGTLLALVGASVGVLFIPTLQEITIASLLWFAIGTSVRRPPKNKNLREIQQ